VKQRFTDNDNEHLTRVGTEILQRALSEEGDIEEFDDVMQQVVEDSTLLLSPPSCALLPTEAARDISLWPSSKCNIVLAALGIYGGLLTHALQ
jgi:hypothetical protein